MFCMGVWIVIWIVGKDLELLVLVFGGFLIRQVADHGLV